MAIDDIVDHVLGRDILFTTTNEYQKFIKADPVFYWLNLPTSIIMRYFIRESKFISPIMALLTYFTGYNYHIKEGNDPHIWLALAITSYWVDEILSRQDILDIKKDKEL